MRTPSLGPSPQGGGKNDIRTPFPPCGGRAGEGGSNCADFSHVSYYSTSGDPRVLPAPSRLVSSRPSHRRPSRSMPVVPASAAGNGQPCRSVRRKILWNEGMRRTAVQAVAASIIPRGVLLPNRSARPVVLLDPQRPSEPYPNRTPPPRARSAGKQMKKVAQTVREIPRAEYAPCSSRFRRGTVAKVERTWSRTPTSPPRIELRRARLMVRSQSETACAPQAATRVRAARDRL
jgi:hypothetical protein